jgi:hypothetical protein
MQNKVHGFKLNGVISGYLEKYHGGGRTIQARRGYKNSPLRDERKKTGME